MDNFRIDEELLRAYIRNEILRHEVEKIHEVPTPLMIVVFSILAIVVIAEITIYLIL
jgi:hypothetical protein